MSPWKSLETIRAQSAVIAAWRSRLGDHLGPFQAAFLQHRTEPATHYPCPARCGCAHEIIHHSSTDIIAVCRCDPCNCDDIRLTPGDIAVWELSWPKLGRALCQALNLDPRPAEFGLYNTRQIGSWSADAVPVILTIPTERYDLRSTIGELGIRLQKPFILLAPTTDLMDATCLDLLDHARAGFFDLASHVLLMDQGTLQPAKAPGELFAKFTPQPKETDESVAHQAFALVKALDSERHIKDPTALTVFSLYCIDGLSVSQLARKCRCSRGTVCNRLALIRRKTGADPDSLRQLSSHFAKIEHDLTDPRAAHIHRKRLLYDTPDPEDE